MINFDFTPEEFRSEYFERKPRHMPGALAERPVRWSDIDRLLHGLDPGIPTIQMFHHGQLPEQAYIEEFAEVGKTRRRLNKAKFYEYMGNGATLQINWLERHLVEAKRLCLEVGRFAGAQTSSNAYMSFSGDGSFGKHWDTHDVFVIQLIGRKLWRIYEPTFPLPLAYQTNDRSGHNCPAEPAVELYLEEGDVMYVPRGWWHHVIPLQAGSFHVAVGCYSATLFDYIVQTSAKCLEQQLGARAAFSTDRYREAVSQALERLSDVLLDPDNAAAFERDWLSRERMNAEFNLASLDSAASPLAKDARVSLATFRHPTPDDGILVVNGAQLQLEPVPRAVAAALSNVESLPLDALCAELPDIPPETIQRAVLDLARHDIITIQSR